MRACFGIRELATITVGVAVVSALVARGGAAAPLTAHACPAPPTPGNPVWIDYGDGSTPAEVREVFSRPGVVVAATGTGIPSAYRAKGAQTAFFVLKLPAIVGTPGAPSDPTTIAALADRTYDRAVASTECTTPWIALNELAAPAAPLPWSDSVRGYRANVLALMERLSERGATPALLVHGAPVYTGESRTWWRSVADAGHIVYESYYRAPGIVGRGRIIGPRRLRLGMRSVMRNFAGIGVPRDRLGLMLGFQVAPGKFGREGLQPSTEWYRYVKWNALAARQVAREERIASIWSWGWGNLSAQAIDPDKPRAACVYLWARDQRLCDGPAAAGPGFNRSLVEGPIVMPDTVQCLSVAGKLARATVNEHHRLLRDLDAAVSATFVRHALRRSYPVSGAQVAAAEDEVIASAFSGSRETYEADLATRRVPVAVARGILEDRLRRDMIEQQFGPSGVLPAVANAVTAAIDTATCRGDRLPGRGNFPVTDRRESAGIPLGQLVPYLLNDTDAPDAPTNVVVRGTAPTATLDWDDPVEADVLGYLVYRSVAGLPAVALFTQPWPRSNWNDPRSLDGARYAVQAVDAAGNMSPLVEATLATPPAPRSASPRTP